MNRTRVSTNAFLITMPKRALAPTKTSTLYEYQRLHRNHFVLFEVPTGQPRISDGREGNFDDSWVDQPFNLSLRKPRPKDPQMSITWYREPMLHKGEGLAGWLLALMMSGLDKEWLVGAM